MVCVEDKDFDDYCHLCVFDENGCGEVVCVCGCTHVHYEAVGKGGN